MKSRKIKALECEGSEIELVWKEGFDYNYQDTLTIIFNNVRDDNRLLNMTNNSKFSIFVYCLKENANMVKGWLSQFGEVVGVKDVLILTAVDVDYDCKKYNDVVLLTE